MAARRHGHRTPRRASAGGRERSTVDTRRGVYPGRGVGQTAPMGGRSVWFVGPRQVEIREERAPRARATVRCSSTPCARASARAPRCSPTAASSTPTWPVDETIGALGGTFRYPFRYGYSCVGRVEESRSDARRRRSRLRLPSASGPLRARRRRSRAARRRVTPARRRCCRMVETALQITLDAGPVLGDTVVVVGLGVARPADGRAARERAGARVIAVEPQAWRREVVTGLVGNRRRARRRDRGDAGCGTAGTGSVS